MATEDTGGRLSDRVTRSGSRRLVIVGWVIGTGVMTFAAGWSLAVLFEPLPRPAPNRDYLLVSAVEGEIGDSLTLNASATWRQTLAGRNAAAGVVTEVVIDAQEPAQSGDHLYTVDLQPVAVVEGAWPAFRTLDQGVSGRDVVQLQQMLRERGLFGGVTDGVMSPATVNAVRNWQKAAGFPETGAVELGEVIFVPDLPARIVLDREVITRGASVSGGEPAVSVLAGEPSFVLNVTTGQADLITSDAEVSVISPGGDEWQARVGRRTDDQESDMVTFALEGRERGGLCADKCEQVPTGRATLLEARVVTVPEVRGVLVPSSAVSSDAAGETFVLAEDGAPVGVDVVASGEGSTIVRGLEIGDAVRVPAALPSAAEE